MQNKQVKLQDFEILQTLGTGSFGRVRLAKQKSNQKHVALKMLKKCEILRLKQVDHTIQKSLSECISSEFKILRQIQHPFIIELLGYTQDERYLYFVLEYIQGGELFTYLRNAGTIENDEAQFYSAQIVLMFEYLLQEQSNNSDSLLLIFNLYIKIQLQYITLIHSKTIVYRDLKPENLLVQQNGYLKLTDFGFAKVVEDHTYTLCGTPEYLAPEILLNKGHSRPVDWWCLGIIIYEMLAGIDPFNDEDPMAIYQKILKGKVKFPKNFDNDAKELIKNLLVSDVSKRLGNLKNGVNDIKQHKWYQTLNWDNLIKKQIRPKYIPSVRSDDDTSNFAVYPDSTELADSIKQNEDPFKDW